MSHLANRQFRAEKQRPVPSQANANTSVPRAEAAQADTVDITARHQFFNEGACCIVRGAARTTVSQAFSPIGGAHPLLEQGSVIGKMLLKDS